MARARQGQDEDHVEPLSFSGVWRSSLAQMEVYKTRPTPACAFLLSLACWVSGIWRIMDPTVVDPVSAGVCLHIDALYSPSAGDLRRYVLHGLWPRESGYIRAFFSSVVLLILGYALEHDIGTPHFAALFVGMHVVGAAALVHFQFVGCVCSFEVVLVAMTVVMHRLNPKVYTDGLHTDAKVGFAIEPRWHLWVLLSILLLYARDFPVALAVHSVGLFVGAIATCREPEVLVELVQAIRSDHPKVGIVIHVSLLLFALLFMPLTSGGFPLAALPSAMRDGRAFSLLWWQHKTQSSPSLVQMGLGGMIENEAMYISKLIMVTSVPLLLTPFRMWLRVYSIFCLVLLGYSMNSSMWHYPNIGFVVLIYLVWAFWKLYRT